LASNPAMVPTAIQLISPMSFLLGVGLSSLPVLYG
jgi:hypothetical protein